RHMSDGVADYVVGTPIVRDPAAGVTPIAFVIDDDISVRESLELLIRTAGWDAETFASAEEFIAHAPSAVPSCVILDLSLPGLNGLELQMRLAGRPDLPIIFITGHTDVPMTVQAMKAGAVDFLTKPVDSAALLESIGAAIERSRLALHHDAALLTLRNCHSSQTPREREVDREDPVRRREVHPTALFDEIVGASPALQPMLDRIGKVSQTDSTVLINGETGTGKELVARAIHRRSARASRAFVSVNCAAIPRELIASALFGHEKGAFTGATERRLGRFEQAHGGTIFLDEVGELPTETQVALLRVLQEREFERVGG